MPSAKLELKQGDAAEFFRLAAEINAACPLPISATAKADRGYQLLEGRGPQPCKAPKFALSGKDSVHHALSEVFATCLKNVIDNEAACIDGTDPEGVHQARVSMRRLRSALWVFRSYLDPARIEWMREDLKWVGNSLGAARDWDVYITETIHNVEGYGVDADGIAKLRDAAEAERTKAYEVVRETFRSERYARLIFRLTSFVALEGWLARPLDPNEPLLRKLEDCASRILNRPYRKLTSGGSDMETMSIDERHEVRIRLKKLRYAGRLSHRRYPGGKTSDFSKALHLLQDAFGHLNDVAQAMRLSTLLSQPGGETQPDEALLIASGQVQGWYAHALRRRNRNWLRTGRCSPTRCPFGEASLDHRGCPIGVRNAICPRREFQGRLR